MEDFLKDFVVVHNLKLSYLSKKNCDYFNFTGSMNFDGFNKVLSI